jgi:glycosyltransferase involved in cell wall biosynthesis
LKVLILGDSPFGKTGFGRVNYHAMKAFLDAGLEVGVVPALQTKKNPPTTDLPVTLFVPDDSDQMGLSEAMSAIKSFKPDAIYGTGDPGNVGGFAAVLPARIPFVAYVPIEGAPLVHLGWRQVLSYIDFFTCSEYGTRVIRDAIGRDIDYVYHGVDRETFTPLSTDERDEYRQRLGWDGKFVITCVAQNVRRKQIPRLIEAVAILKHKLHQKDIILYLHSVPYQQHWLEGWNLPEIASAFNVYDEVVFNPLMHERGAFVPERGNLEVPGLRELMGASDIGMIPSQVEGFCLPLVEMMASGLPLMTTKYAAGWEVARHADGVGIAPRDWEIHKSGTRYANIDPMDIAKEIIRLRRNPKQLERMRAKGLEASSIFDWKTFEDYVAQKVINAASSAPQTESPEARQVDQTALEAAEDLFRPREATFGREAQASLSVV